MVWCSYTGLPRDLKSAGEVLGIKKTKQETGTALIKRFCLPDAGGHYCTPDEFPEEWEDFVQYNIRDVEVEREIWHRLQKYPMPEVEWLYYRLDQCINQRGVRIDRLFVQQAITLDGQQREKPFARFQQLTGLQSPSCTKGLIEWFEKKGVQVKNLSEKTVTDLLSSANGPVKEVLQLRKQLSKTSIRKYDAMMSAVGDDDRLRGMFRFYGTHTGRWSGKLVQLQNLPKNQLKNLDAARNAVRNGESPEMISILYGPSAEVLSQLLRTAFIPEDGCVFYVADYVAIEARVLAWLAGEKWRMQAFANGEDIYCSSASQMFGVPVVKGGINANLRQKGKIAELALGYGGSVGALMNMGALRLGLQESELPELVQRWRKSNPNITAFWRQIDQVVKHAVRQKTTVSLRHLTVNYLGDILTIRLPSGRELFYREPALESGPYGGNFVYSGIDETRRYTRIRSYGARIVENITQAVSRDLLAAAMIRLEKAGYHIVMHCHDETVVEAPEGKATLKDICGIMQQTLPWAKGLLLRADGYICPYYQKK